MRHALFAILLMAGLLCSGCHQGGKNNLTAPNISRDERQSQNFPDAPTEIFGDNGFPLSVYNDVAMAGIATIAGSAPGTPQQLTDNHIGTAVVTLERNSSDPTAPFKPVCRWLQDAVGGYRSDWFFVANRDVEDQDHPQAWPTNNVEYRNPKCVACAYQWGGLADPNLCRVSCMLSISLF